MTSGVNLREVVDFSRTPEADEQLRLLYEQTQVLVGEAFKYWSDNGQNCKLLRRSRSGDFAVVVKVLRDKDAFLELTDSLNDPNVFFDFCYLYDVNDPVRYAANALRKMRATGRTGVDTLTLKQQTTGAFVDVTDGSEDTLELLPWGEFPYGGAVLVHNGQQGDNRTGILVGVSGFDEQEDHVLAEFMAKMLLLKLTMNAEGEAAQDTKAASAG